MLEIHHDMEEDENNEDEDEEELGDPHEDDDGPTEFLDHEPTKQEKMDVSFCLCELSMCAPLNRMSRYLRRNCTEAYGALKKRECGTFSIKISLDTMKS